MKWTPRTYRFNVSVGPYTAPVTLWLLPLLVFLCNMLLQDPNHREELDDDVENAFSNINGTVRQSSQFADVSSIDVPLTHLPVLTPRSKTANSRTGLAKSLPYASLNAPRSTIEEQNV